MALTDYEKELFKKELPKHYTVQVFDDSGTEIDVIENERIDYESINLIESMTNNDQTFNFGIAFSSNFKFTFHNLANGLFPINYNGSKIIVTQKIDYIEPITEINKTAELLVGTFWIDTILLKNDRSKQYEINAYDYMNKIKWKDINLKEYNLGMPYIDETIAYYNYVGYNYKAYYKKSRNMNTSLAYMTDGLYDEIDLGQIPITYLQSGGVDYDFAIDPDFIALAATHGLTVLKGDAGVENFNYLGKGNWNIAYQSILIKPTDATNFKSLKKILHAYNIKLRLTELKAITSFYAALPDFFTPRLLIYKENAEITKSFYEISNNQDFEFVSYLTDLITEENSDTVFLEIPVRITKLYTTTVTNRNIRLFESAALRICETNQYDTFVDVFLDNQDEYALAINTDEILNQKDFFDGMAKWFLYNISATKNGELQIKRLYNLDLAMSNYGRTENDPIIKSVNILNPSELLTPGEALVAIGNQDVIEMSKIKEIEIASILKGVKKITYIVNGLSTNRTVFKNGIHTVVDSEIGTLSITFDNIAVDSEIILDASNFSDNFLRDTNIGDPELPDWDDKRGYILMSALQYLNRTLGSIEISSIPYLTVGDFVYANLKDETFTMLIVKNEIKGISVAQTQTITSM